VRQRHRASVVDFADLPDECDYIEGKEEITLEVIGAALGFV
jgi:hypothetical protein